MIGIILKAREPIWGLCQYKVCLLSLYIWGQENVHWVGPWTQGTHLKPELGQDLVSYLAYDNASGLWGSILNQDAVLGYSLLPGICSSK